MADLIKCTECGREILCGRYPVPICDLCWEKVRRNGG